MAQMAKRMGLLVCVPSTGAVVLFSQYDHSLTAYGLDGKRRWQSSLAGFTPLQIVVTPTSIAVDPAGPSEWHVGTEFVAIGGDDLAVQLVTIVRVGQKTDPERTTVVLSARTGAELARSRSLRRLVAAAGIYGVFVEGDLFPNVVRRELHVERQPSHERSGGGRW